MNVSPAAGDAFHAALVPVRTLCDAKRRLASELTACEREELALVMLADMLEALTAAPSLDRIVVVSSDRTVLAEAEGLGAHSLHEREPRGLNGAVRWAAAQLEASGARSLLTIPGDVPLLETAEVEALLALAGAGRDGEVDQEAPDVVLVPSASGTGTNALLSAPPTVIEPAFEGLSLDAHRRACRAAGVDAATIVLPGFALDVDTPDDLLELARRGVRRRSGRFAAQLLERRVLAARASG